MKFQLRKLTRKTLLEVCVCILALLHAEAAFALGNSDGYYLVFDEYTMTNAGSSGITAPSSYDAFQLAGNVSNGTINDTSKIASTTAQRYFNSSNGEIVWEIGFSAGNAPNGCIISLRSGEVNAVELFFEGSKLYARTKNGREVLNDDHGFYGIKAFINIDKKTYRMQVNGKTIPQELTFVNLVDALDNFYIETSKEGTGVVNLLFNRIYKGYLINEWFMTSHQQLPDDWTTYNVNDTAIIQQKSSIQNDVYSLQITDGNYTKASGIYHDIESYEGGLWFEFQFRIPEKVGQFNAILTNEKQGFVKIGTKGTDFGYWKGKEFKKLYSMKKNLWYHAMVKLMPNGETKIYLNHKLLHTELNEDNVKIIRVNFEIGKAATGTVLLDDIMVKPNGELPEDYCPEPQIPQKKDPNLLVAVQSCNIWREGTHFGWDSIEPYPERIPYLGLYDEGSTEARDWETKWMVEHGIDVEIYCWYRQPSSAGEPIKRPRNSFGLNDAFLNSEYSDKMKFVISLENGSTATTGIDDFEKNLVPYWIEMYFKDDRYLKIDNKPVVGFYQLSGLVRDFGGYDGAKKALDLLDKMCKYEGFDGVYIIMTNGSSDTSTLENIKKIGIDALYCYSWGMSSYNIEVQKSGIKKQSQKGIVDIIATLGSGRDDTPWNRSHGGFCTLEDYKKLLEWARDEYVPSVSKNSLAGRMICLDNWNEYGEGHFICPSGLYGFGYVDAVRDVFCEPSEHQDTVPSEEAKIRFNKLYVQDRHVEKTFEAKQYYKSLNETDDNNDKEFVVLKKYEFDENENIKDYPISRHITDYKMENSVLSGTATDGDPGFYITDVNLPAESVKQIKVKIKYGSGEAKFQIYYTTDISTNWQEAKSLAQSVVDAKDFVEITLDTANATAWDGVVTDVRIDPLASAGTFAIDSVEFLGYDLGKDNNLNIDGKAQYPTRDIIVQNGMMYVGAKDYAAFFGFRYSETLDKKYLMLLNDEIKKLITLEYGKDTINVDGEPYIPLRYIAQEAGYSVLWNSENGTVNVVSNNSGDGGQKYVPDPPMTFNFNKQGDFQGITGFTDISGQTVSRGVLAFSSTSTDPRMSYSKEFKAEDYLYCNIRIKNKSDGTRFQIYYTTAEDITLNEAKSVAVTMLATSSEFVNYTLNMASSSAWKGTIKSLRIDPTNGVGDVEIDYIIFSKDKIEGNSAAFSEFIKGDNIVFGGIMEIKNLNYKCDGVSAEYSNEKAYGGRTSLKVMSNSAGKILIPANIAKDNVYYLNFFALSQNIKEIKIGYYAGDKFTFAQSLEFDANGAWQELGSKIKPELDKADGIYFELESGSVYIDNLRLGEAKTSAE